MTARFAPDRAPLNLRAILEAARRLAADLWFREHRTRPLVFDEIDYFTGGAA
jgi:hypothetical protein